MLPWLCALYRLFIYKKTPGLTSDSLRSSSLRSAARFVRFMSSSVAVTAVATAVRSPVATAVSSMSERSTGSSPTLKDYTDILTQTVRDPIYHSIDKFFSNKQHFDLLCSVLSPPPGHDPPISLRVLQFAVRKALEYDPAYFNFYRNAINENGKACFDAFRRADSGHPCRLAKHGKVINTTLAQANFFRLIIAHGILQKILRNVDHYKSLRRCHQLSKRPTKTMKGCRTQRTARTVRAVRPSGPIRPKGPEGPSGPQGPARFCLFNQQPLVVSFGTPLPRDPRGPRDSAGSSGGSE